MFDIVLEKGKPYSLRFLTRTTFRPTILCHTIQSFFFASNTGYTVKKMLVDRGQSSVFPSLYYKEKVQHAAIDWMQSLAAEVAKGQNP